MHIVYITHEYPKLNFSHGGVGTFIQTLSRWLISKGHTISIVGMNYNSFYEEEFDLGVQIYRMPKCKIKGITWLLHNRLIAKKISDLHQTRKIDIVEGTELSFAFLPKIKSVRYLIRLHGGHHFFAESENRKINWWKGFQEKRSFLKADGVIGVSQYAVNQTAKYLSFQNKLKGVVNYPLNLDKFYTANYREKVNGRVFFVGTICEKKGIRQLIEAMKIVKKEFSDAHLVIAGRDWFFPDTGKSYTEYLEEIIDRDMRSSIEFIGTVPNSDIPGLIEKSQICCYPSHMETFGIVAIEAMAMAKPTIFTELGPGTEVIQDRVTGLLCNPHNPQNIASKIIWFMQNREEAENIGFRAREMVLAKYSLDFIGNQNLDLYNSLL